MFTNITFMFTDITWRHTDRHKKYFRGWATNYRESISEGLER